MCPIACSPSPESTGLAATRHDVARADVAGPRQLWNRSQAAGPTVSPPTLADPDEGVNVQEWDERGQLGRRPGPPGVPGLPAGAVEDLLARPWDVEVHRGGQSDAPWSPLGPPDPQTVDSTPPIRAAHGAGDQDVARPNHHVSLPPGCSAPPADRQTQLDAPRAIRQQRRAEADLQIGRRSRTSEPGRPRIRGSC